VNAIADHEVYRTGDLTAEPRWPVFAPAAAHATTPLDRDEAGSSPAETVREVMSISLACSVIPGRDQSAVHDRDRIHPSLPGRGRRQQRPNRVDRPMRRGMRHPEQRPDLAHRQIRPPVRRDRQHPVGQWQRPLPARPGERGNPLRPRRCDHLHHTNMINYRPRQSGTGLRDIP
jgi:hypothetical protein